MKNRVIPTFRRHKYPELVEGWKKFTNVQIKDKQNDYQFKAFVLSLSKDEWIYFYCTLIEKFGLSSSYA